MRLVFCLKCARVTGRKRAANEQLHTGVQPHLQAFRVSAIADFGGQQKAAAAVFPARCARDPPQTDTMGGGEVRWCNGSISAACLSRMAYLLVVVVLVEF